MGLGCRQLQWQLCPSLDLTDLYLLERLRLDQVCQSGLCRRRSSEGKIDGERTYPLEAQGVTFDGFFV